VLPNGHVLVIESKAPEGAAVRRPKDLVMPFGVALVGSDFYVANTDAIVRYP
jgi:glucose/arabinose dehydrogenase